MVLESLIGAEKIKERPLYMFMLSFVYASIAIFIAYFVFYPELCWPTLFLTMLAAVPTMVQMLNLETFETLQEIKQKRFRFFYSHADILKFFLCFFFGFTFAFTLAYVILPNHLTQLFFMEQEATISRITGSFASDQLFLMILGNNLKVLFFCLAFSFIYGAGAIFILTWNASVLAVAIGNFIKQRFALIGGLAVPLALGRYLIHGIPELIAYFLAAIAGGLLGVYVTKVPKNKAAKKLLVDVANLIMFAVLLLVLAASLEVSVSPLVG